MPAIRAQVVVPTVTNLPRDRITNTLYFDNESEGTFEQASDVIALLLEEFYDGVYASPYQPESWLNFAGGWWINFYDMSAPEPRVPYRVDIAGGTIGGTNSVIPSEVSLVMSFHGAHINGQSQARRRGRIYLAGVAAPWLEQETAGAYPTFVDGVLNRVNTEAEALLDASGTALVGWSVFSQVAGTLAHVVGGWCDEAPDTQRRRGQDSNERISWTT